MLSYFARMLPFDDFEQVCERFRVLTDPDGGHRDHVDAREARNVTSGFVGAEFLLRARGGVPAGAAMIAVLDAFVQVEFAADVAELRERCGENAPMVLLRRTDDAAGRATGPTEPKSRHSNNQNTNTTTTTGDHAAAHDTEPSELEGCRRITMSEIGDLPRHQIVRRESVHVQQLTRDPR